MMSVLRSLTVLVLLVAAFWVGMATGTKRASGPGGAGHVHSPLEPAKASRWTCAMHPNVNLPKPGKCPICFMALVPVAEAGGPEGARVLELSPTAKALADIQTTPVRREFVSAQVRMVGKVDYDETRLAYITAWVPGRLDRLFVGYTGVPVNKGEHMVHVYSPDLYAAQQELLQSIRANKELERSDVPFMKQSAAATVQAARERLRLWGLAEQQVAEVERRGTPDYHTTIYAPIGGIVIHKNGFEGMYVQTGTRIYTIADLKRVWVRLDAYESDLGWIRYGQRVQFTAEAYPGRQFVGRVSFIAPMLDAATRTVKVRLNVDNEDGRLKPEMFVRASLRADLTARGLVMDPDLAGKWICTMHPEVVKDGAGKCDVCEMPLVSTESLGFAKAPKETEPPLVIPDTAPLITGRRAVVYVQVPGKQGLTFEGREVVLGPRAGRYYIVEQGLEEGELVVTTGSFKLDSALQIRAKPSMMAMPGGPVAQGSAAEPDGRKGPSDAKAPEPFVSQLDAVLSDYLRMWQALAADDPVKAATAAGAIERGLTRTDAELLPGGLREAWRKEQPAFQKLAGQLAGAKGLTAQREVFALFSESLAGVLAQFGHPAGKPIFRAHCSMAFNNRGAIWLQDSEDVLNPYFGAAMLHCGSVVSQVK